jgi:hypothetical protein
MIDLKLFNAKGVAQASPGRRPEDPTDEKRRQALSGRHNRALATFSPTGAKKVPGTKDAFF